MSVLLVVHLLFTAAYAGFQWTVQVVVYRQFGLVPAAAFTAFEAAHQRRVTYVVGPLFAGQAITSAGLLIAGDGALRFVSIGLFAAVLGVTGLLAVPLHRRLSTGFDAATHRCLLRVDLVRAGLATVNAIVAAALLR
ncbi:hypothetical protein [Nakamurella deserti]|uniref:hypothetical protein n=1 Tax=Nakamurella deserti TaxID=2164074 RepID=UPI00197BF1C9|nr:hypothetical protein [Nakamurella deserti]